MPSILLADIHLADGSSGLDAVKDILNGFEVPVIFITTSTARLLTGKRPKPAFLVAKLFVPGMVKVVISQALHFDYKRSRNSVFQRNSHFRSLA